MTAPLRPPLRAVAALALLVGAAGCAPPGAGPPRATLAGHPAADAGPALIEAARRAHGAAVLDRAELAFAFRGTPFTLRRDGGAFRYARTLADSAGRRVEEVVDNAGTHRLVNGNPVPLAPDEARRVETAVNSVAYFALLPYPLADPAARGRLAGRDTLAGTAYHRVEVTFGAEGGGRDWEDRYLVWLHPARRTMDYLAYSYALGPGEAGPHATGHRFRRVTGVTEAAGVRVQDYENLTAAGLGRLEDYPAALAAGRLHRVSDVVLDSVRVRPLR